MSEWAENRQLLHVSGADTAKFLQDLVSNDLTATSDGLVYTALLSPKGKYLFDFFVTQQDGAYLIDVAKDRAAALAQRLSLYKLRADVAIAASDLLVNRGLGAPPSDGHADPRHSDMGWRAYQGTAGGAAQIDWDARRVVQCIPETGIELIPDQTYILEAGFERLNGVDFRKGCYVGQEVTARMKHKTELRKGFALVSIEGNASIGTDIMSEGKVAGQLFTQSGGSAIAYLRFDRASGDMNAEGAVIRYHAPT
ncbi:aminomethyltransferase [Amylibacter marinus]|uniref:Aminomethyltransferase n=1 Tax=Amylibacter marinus TaxID=1475483 RepID=A0ABQ5VRK8_9RHOB|nr:folate-binding protein [Amylibacter marinus]GLQ33884.1 aminomethyltransferase [Amylibacter marinus]